MPSALRPHAADLQEAITFYLEFLHRDPSNWEMEWLLNLAYMSAGTYPDKVPAQFLIRPDSFRSKQNIGQFIDVAPRAG